MALALFASSAQALELNLGESSLTIDNLFTVGALVRTQERDPSLISKGNLNPGMCVRRINDTLAPRGQNSFTGDTCTITIPAANQRYVDAPGAYSNNGDNGNLNFDRGEIVYATAKLTSEFSTELAGFSLGASTIYFFDDRYADYAVEHPDINLQVPRSDFSGAAREAVGTDFDLLEYHASRVFPIGERELRIKVGNQILNWGESAFLLFNSLNSINPPDAPRLRVPGFDLKELLQPMGMALFNVDLVENMSLETFYGYEWKPVILDPQGSYFSTVDGVGGGDKPYFMLAYGKIPEDPDGLYRPIDNPNAPVGTGDPQWALGVASSRTIYRDAAEERRRRPDDGGQYGVALKWFLPDFNNGTELGFYFANYHSRIPVVSAIAAQAGCLQNADTFVEDCGFQGPGVDADNPSTPQNEEPLPVDTARAVLEYPENVRMYGISFNTTVGDYALSGEYAFRDNLPIQINLVDLTSAALQPSLPPEDISLGAVTVAGRRSAAPDFLTAYRGRMPGSVQPGEFIPGYERMKSGQLGLTVLRIIGGDNLINASQIILLLETGLNHVLDFPDVSELQFQGGQVDTPITAGADGTVGINPLDVRTDPDNPRSTRVPQTLRTSPHAHDDLKALGTELSYGYRLLSLVRYQNALFGANLEGLLAFNHDVDGTSPGIGTNFVEGRKQIQAGLRFDYLTQWVGELRHTWYTGGAHRDTLRDRDNLSFFVGYQF